LSGAGAEVLYVVLAVIVEELCVRRAKRISGLLLRRFIVAHGDADHVVARAEVLDVPAHMVGVVAERSLHPSREIADCPVRFALDVNPCKSLLAVRYIATVRSEAGPLQALTRLFERRVVG